VNGRIGLIAHFGTDDDTPVVSASDIAAHRSTISATNAPGGGADTVSGRGIPRAGR